MTPKFYLLHLKGGTILTQNGPYATEEERRDEHDRLKGNFVDHDHVIRDDSGADTWMFADVTADGDLIIDAV